MATVSMSKGAVPSRIRLSAVTAVGVLWLFVGCVDLTPPWSKVTAHGGAGGSGGATPDGAAGAGGALDAGAGGRIDTGGLGGTSGEAGGLDGAIDAPPPGTGGAIDAGRGGAGGAIDVAISGTGGRAFDGGAGGAPDVPLTGTGGVATGGTTSGSGGKATGGTTTGSGGKATGGTTTGTGGTARTGGATGTGGTTGTGGATTPDAAPDLPTDTTPDTSTLGNGLVAYYPCESATGTNTLPDMSGHGYDGTLVNGLAPDGGTASTGTGYSFGAGKVGNALTLYKAGYGHVRVPTAVFANATDMTIAVWANITTSQSWPRILDVGVTPTTYLFNNTATGTKYLNIVPKNMGSNMLFSITKDGYNNEQTLSTTNLSAGVWKHLAVVLSGGTGTLYIDGGTTTVTNPISLRPTDLGTIDYAFIAKSRFDADPPFDGIVDEFRVYSRALSAAEVLALYSFTGP